MKTDSFPYYIANATKLFPALGVGIMVIIHEMVRLMAVNRAILQMV